MRAILADPSVVIDDLDQFDAAVAPHETDAPLIVDPNAVLALPIALESFEAVAGRCCQFGEPGYRIEHVELAMRHLLDRLEGVHGLATEQRRGPPVSEGPDHRSEI